MNTNKPQTPPPQTEHPEAKCQKCGNDNVVWFAPNELWNKVVDDKTAILCPVCFVKMAEAKGIKPTGWLLQEEPKNGSEEPLLGLNAVSAEAGKPTIPQTEQIPEREQIRKIWRPLYDMGTKGSEQVDAHGMAMLVSQAVTETQALLTASNRRATIQFNKELIANDKDGKNVTWLAKAYNAAHHNHDFDLNSHECSCGISKIFMVEAEEDIAELKRLGEE